MPAATWGSFWLGVWRLFGELGIPKDSAAGRRQFELRTEGRRRDGNPAEWKVVRRGWCLGDDEFRRELLAQMGEKVGEHHYGAERQESAEEKAEGLVVEWLRAARVKEQTLGQIPKGAPVKLAVAQRLRSETTVSLKWIAARLQMGAWTSLNNLLYRKRRAKR